MQDEMNFAQVETSAARANDPDTSHLAERDMNATKQRHRWQTECANAVNKNPGHTSRELSLLSGIPNEIMHKRLSELAEEGIIRRGDKKECTVTRKMAVVWWSS